MNRNQNQATHKNPNSLNIRIIFQAKKWDELYQIFKLTFPFIMIYSIPSNTLDALAHNHLKNSIKHMPKLMSLSIYAWKLITNLKQTKSLAQILATWTANQFK